MTTATHRSDQGAAERRHPARVRLTWLVALVVVLAAAALASVVLGARDIGFDDVVAGLGGSQDNLAQAAVAKRVPRTLLAVVVGAALGISGAVMQGVTRNPLADPGILGVNSGASLAIAVGMTSFGLVKASAHIWVAIFGAAVTAVLVYTIGSLGRGGPTPLKLALAGAVSSAALTSLISAVVLSRNDISATFRSWQIGGVGGGSYEGIAMVLPFLVVGLLLCLATARGLNSLALGDDVAAGLGERVLLTRTLASVGAVVLCGAATAAAGPIGFVGLVLPHLCRLLVGPDHRWLLPFSALGGAALLTAADVVGRVVTRPEEIDVGIITALIGAPFFIWIVRRQKVRSL
ncbi:iron ABC transporter permease [Actinosynnema pretiosum subsp. pretiosum]|uniref:Transport system permease protein n=2 Tax=Actinosynnema TaxID=40566 RepID=C6WIQ9_ACTMD|nr:iron ABC transporter permease [Actinosynnema mirum]ACU38149.1 transport system permease protein [Actinosynnema mirum DSM 43827]AXX31650.1 ABC-type Fe3+-siderophore transport system, permease component [Actinosynnema pretiosum subsp. pretiosum]QUF04331.1 iron ABC transporter permease [Actinosynnema pretiosum subsp. pretiosum]